MLLADPQENRQRVHIIHRFDEHGTHSELQGGMQIDFDSIADAHHFAHFRWVAGPIGEQRDPAKKGSRVRFAHSRIVEADHPAEPSRYAEALERSRADRSRIVGYRDDRHLARKPLDGLLQASVRLQIVLRMVQLFTPSSARLDVDAELEKGVGQARLFTTGTIGMRSPDRINTLGRTFDGIAELDCKSLNEKIGL